MVFTYPAVFHPNEDGSFDGYFPDLEGCKFHGQGIDDAINNAINEEKDWLLVELEDEAGLPYVSDFDDITLQDGEFVRPIQAIMHLQDGFDE